jgi:peroxiredoxin
MAMQWGFKKWVGLLLLAAVALAVYWGLTQKPDAPSLQAVDITGQAVSLAQWRGHPVLVDFWATSCPGCVQEMPKLAAFYRQFHPMGFELLAVAMSYDDANQVRRLVAEQKLPFTVVVDTDGHIAQSFGGVTVTPTDFLIDGRGKIVQQIIGDKDFSDLARRVKSSD